MLLCLYLMLGVCSLSVLVLYETLLLPVLMYGSETIWKEVRSQIWAVQMDYLRGFLGIRRMDIVPNARIREFCGVRKGLDQCFSKWAMRKFNEAVGGRVQGYGLGCLDVSFENMGGGEMDGGCSTLILGVYFGWGREGGRSF